MQEKLEKTLFLVQLKQTFSPPFSDCFKKEPKSDDYLSKFDWHDLSSIFLAKMILHNLKVF